MPRRQARIPCHLTIGGNTSAMGTLAQRPNWQLSNQIYAAMRVLVRLTEWLCGAVYRLDELYIKP
jgi:hypothetical protein